MSNIQTFLNAHGFEFRTHLEDFNQTKKVCVGIYDKEDGLLCNLVRSYTEPDSCDVRHEGGIAIWKVDIQSDEDARAAEFQAFGNMCASIGELDVPTKIKRQTLNMKIVGRDREVVIDMLEDVKLNSFSPNSSDILKYFTDNNLELRISTNYHSDKREIVATLFDNGTEVQMLYASDSNKLRPQTSINGVDAKWSVDFPIRTAPEEMWSKLFLHIIEDIAAHRNALLTNTFSTNGVKRTRDLCLCIHDKEFEIPKFQNFFLNLL